jgi:hypothetical protein
MSVVGATVPVCTAPVVVAAKLVRAANAVDAPVPPCAISTPADLIVTAPAVTEKSPESNDAIPVTVVVARSVVLTNVAALGIDVPFTDVTLGKDVVADVINEPLVGMVTPLMEVMPVGVVLSPMVIPDVPPFHVVPELNERFPPEVSPRELVVVAVTVPVPPRLMVVPFMVTNGCRSFPLVILPANMALVTVPVSAWVTAVPEIFVDAIAADVLMSELTIVPSTMLSVVTDSGVFFHRLVAESY